MDERALLLLGLLKNQSQHGYQINEFIERNVSQIMNLKKATAYAILNRLHEAGYVTLRMEQEENRPPRKVYSITKEGEKEFYRLLQENLSHLEQVTLPGDIGLMFLDHLSPYEVICCLQARLKNLEEQIKVYERVPKHEHNPSVDLTIDRRLRLLKSDRDWLQDTIAHLLKKQRRDT
ncbi:MULTISPECIES: PadR family transcriptional regulator [Aneurinibacillus]|uniref:PadR family transcriptional regulator n=1 Tax=Aneurinibacillus thermoaerophilus TaxID=143495 RepID=A0A1G7X7D2_ANETH|nr:MULTISPECIES: helix-turn-helix transcriptional regulator [Aneurinibacillus]AMA73237.1 PadR family transcriptional regulator [Aneurinibacillus sp. XH2]MED0674334.1 helix-turn-helix transcriptional regulator [Aneurinibacillus thermoaerophilus]MED0678352.1 helix-turn-helix transcriptional regulator [Aneurinibacillus thermoaerophilus]MED0736123.1 helix-turn-helix transcriptional regulator [Aneurinibacillus thermoaerophilus]MED0756967.1 helix-turn-helix transcriptional regulator [Aneurinibacillu